MVEGRFVAMWMVFFFFFCVCVCVCVCPTKRSASPLYTVVKVDGATPKRFRIVRGHDKPIHASWKLRHLLSRWYKCLPQLW